MSGSTATPGRAGRSVDDSRFLVGLVRGDDDAYRKNECVAYGSSTIVGDERVAGLIDRGCEDLVDELRRDLVRVDVEPFELADAALTARIELAADGTSIPVPDVMIAATARRRGEALVGADEHVERATGPVDHNARETG